MIQRIESRYPCVGIELMFSPIIDDCIENLGSEIYSAIGHDMSFSGLSFDVVHSMDIGEKIYILIKNQFQPPERLTAEVRWCKKLENGHFRIGVSIISSDGINLDETQYDNKLINIDNESGPSEARLICPSCMEMTTFNLVNNQDGNWVKGIMPLYNCSRCNTTRSIPNILEYNRHVKSHQLKSKTIVFESNQQLRSASQLTRILYVEDEPDIRTVSKMALEMVGGYTVEVCHSGKEALKKVERFNPDLFLLDVMMPDLTGPQTLTELRKQPQFANTPAIFMTAKVQTHEILEYDSPNVLGVIPKPFDPMVLSAELLELWKGK